MKKMIFNTTASPFQTLESLQFSLSSWLDSWYPQICNYLEIDSVGDLIALKSILQTDRSNVTIDNLKAILPPSKKVIAVAPGSELEGEYDTHKFLFEEESNFIISADGSTSFLMEHGILPDLVVSDLDGKVEDQINAQKKGSILAVHVHGDNEDTVKKNLTEVSRYKFLLTTQVNPLDGSYNFFGFTDGDRAVCLATEMKASKIILIGYDFGPKIGKYSKNFELNREMKERKMKKFVIAKSIINWCANTGQKIVLPTSLP